MKSYIDSQIKRLVDHKLGQVDSKFGWISSQVKILRKEIMSTRDGLKKLTLPENNPKVRPEATLKYYKVPKFDGESSWDLYRKQLGIAAISNKTENTLTTRRCSKANWRVDCKNHQKPYKNWGVKLDG